MNGRATEGFLREMSKIGAVTGRTPGVAEQLRSFNARPWTEEEIALLASNSTLEVAKLTGRAVASVEHGVEGPFRSYDIRPTQNRLIRSQTQCIRGSGEEQFGVESLRLDQNGTSFRRLHSPTVAIARELAGFVWTIAQEMRVTMAAG